MSIIYDYENVFQVLSLKFKENPSFHIDKKNADLLLKSSIENDDNELIKLLVKYNVLFTEDILDFIGSSKESVFIEVMENINKNQPDFNWDNVNQTIFDMCESYVSTEKMFLFFIEKGLVDIELLYKEDIPLLIYLCIIKNDSVIKLLLKNNMISSNSLQLKYNNLTLIEYIDRFMDYKIYIDTTKIV